MKRPVDENRSLFLRFDLRVDLRFDFGRYLTFRMFLRAGGRDPPAGRNTEAGSTQKSPLVYLFRFQTSNCRDQQQNQGRQDQQRNDDNCH